MDTMQRLLADEPLLHPVKGARGCLGLNMPNVVECAAAVTIRDLNMMKPKDLHTILDPQQLQGRVLWAVLTKADDNTIYDQKKSTCAPLFDLFSRCELELNDTEEAHAAKAQVIFDLHDGAGDTEKAELLRGYITASRRIEPTIDEDSEATRLVRCYYAEVRKLRVDHLPGQELLEGLVTLAKSFSMIGLRDSVTVYDVCAAIAVIEQSAIVARGYECRGLMESAYLSDLFEPSGASTEGDTYLDEEEDAFERFCEDVRRWSGFDRMHMLTF